MDDQDYDDECVICHVRLHSRDCASHNGNSLCRSCESTYTEEELDEMLGAEEEE